MTGTEPNQLDPTRLSWAMGWLCTIVMGVAVIIMFATGATPTHINTLSTQRERVP